MRVGLKWASSVSSAGCGGTGDRQWVSVLTARCGHSEREDSSTQLCTFECTCSEVCDECLASWPTMRAAESGRPTSAHLPFRNGLFHVSHEIESQRRCRLRNTESLRFLRNLTVAKMAHSDTVLCRVSHGGRGLSRFPTCLLPTSLCLWRPTCH